LSDLFPSDLLNLYTIELLLPFSCMQKGNVDSPLVSNLLHVRKEDLLNFSSTLFRVSMNSIDFRSLGNGMNDANTFCEFLFVLWASAGGTLLDLFFYSWLC
jgi:hypothetical protein